MQNFTPQRTDPDGVNISFLWKAERLAMQIEYPDEDTPDEIERSRAFDIR